MRRLGMWLACVLTSQLCIGPIGMAGQTFRKLSAIAELVDGSKFIIVRDEMDGADYAFARVGDAYGKAVEVAVDDDKVVVGETDDKPLVLEWRVEGGKNYVVLPEGHYLTIEGTTVFTPLPLKNSTSHWTAEMVSASNTELSCANYNGYPIKFITAYGDFRCYKSGAKVVTLFLLDDATTTGIDAVRMPNRAGGIYDLLGRFCGYQTDALKPGVYICNGRKFLKR